MIKISKSTIQRFPLYLKAFRKMESDGITTFKSHDLAEITGVLPTTVRRDFSLIGRLGKQGHGYNVKEIIKIFSEELGLESDEKIILIGVGNLGKAVLHYNEWENVVGKIECGFDLYPENVKNVNVKVYNIKDLATKMPKGARIAILTISHDVQDTVDKLAKCGITGIVNFSKDHIEVPKGVSIRTIDVLSKVQELVFEINKRK